MSVGNFIHFRPASQKLLNVYKLMPGEKRPAAVRYGKDRLG